MIDPTSSAPIHANTGQIFLSEHWQIGLLDFLPASLTPLPAAKIYSSRWQAYFRPLHRSPVPVARKIKPTLLRGNPALGVCLALLLSSVMSPRSLLEAPAFLSACSSSCLCPSCLQHRHHRPVHLAVFSPSIRAQNTPPPPGSLI